ncbi:alpha/beta hydrolase [Streptacidiphilus sp. PB12-B1b]|uniref:alpha/beta fold hydrolase n=1 Tax=Streptacidiphilus sp. PB12-B1b TaxID=2705012 RepID=UPI0015F98EA1|nr:alpha/beta hydrolase [Streptacidiphilus sp. PB12-B1b]QMU77981.1 alpha/beta hydrolase [Streptacidiphilus sp. PB12-B1b]
MALLDLDGLRCHVQRLAPLDGAPPAATAVLVHGLLTDSLASYYFTLGPVLAAAGVEVVMYDQRGHGRTARPPTGYRLDHFLDDLEALLDRLYLTGPVHLLGNSFGGTVAFGLAQRRPEQVLSILAIESEPATPAWAAKMERLLGWTEAQLAREESLAWVAEQQGAHKARLARAAGRLLAETSLARDLPASRVLSEAGIGAIDCPVLAVYGTESDLAEQADWLEGLLPACRSTLVPGQEHSVLVEAPEVVRELALCWLLENGAGLRGPAAGLRRPLPVSGGAVRVAGGAR